ncbi:unnamed protein product, partial [Pocillopora meandrina]
MDEELSNWGDRRDPPSVGLENVPKNSVASGKTRISRIMAELKSCLQQAEELNHDKVLEWHDVDLVRATEALDEVVEHLKARTSEESFVLSSKASFKSSRDPLAFKAKAAATIAYVKRQKRKLFKVKEEAERVRLEAELELEKQRPTSEEAQEMRHWKPKQFDLAEVQAVQNDEGGHGSLE